VFDGNIHHFYYSEFWSVRATELEAMDIEPRFGHPDYRGSKFFQHIVLHGVKIQETVTGV
jgi:hypothetical protein